MNKTHLNARWIFFYLGIFLLTSYTVKKETQTYNILDFVRFGFFLIGLAIKTKKKERNETEKLPFFRESKSKSEKREMKRKKSTTATTSKITTLKKYPSKSVYLRKLSIDNYKKLVS